MPDQKPGAPAERWCCCDCGGDRVEVLDWVTVNEGELVGGDPTGDYFCPDCDTHPSRVELRSEWELQHGADRWSVRWPGRDERK